MSFKWVFAILGYIVARGRGLVVGFLFGCLVDYMMRGRQSFRFTYRTFSGEDFRNSQGAGGSPFSAVYGERLREAYRTLGIDENVTDEEVRRTCRSLVLRYHPDKVATRSESERAAAERIFKMIAEAKDIVFKARGMK